jgi:2-polyprenyl-6-methoxyphenol hydroxylase-like FAD-dependent oxidoreductase
MTTGTPADTQVIVVGAGPTGLMLACELTLLGVRTLVLERLEEISHRPRALGLHRRTVELFHQRGMDWFDDAPPSPMGFGMLRMDATLTADMASRQVPQWHIEERLEARARAQGAVIRRGTEVVGVSQDTHGVRVDAVSANGRERFAAAFAVGCDGAHSIVRKSAGIGFSGRPPTVYGINGEVVLAGDDVPRTAGATLYPAGMLGIFPLGGDLFRVTCHLYGVDPPGRDTPVTVDDMRSAVRRVSGIDLDIRDVQWISRFGNANRLADRYRAGRVLVAGDAAHVHYTAGAQGMNTGIQDAVNLGWKLAAEVQGRAPEGLLDGYETERRPIGARVCRNTLAQTALMYPLEEVSGLRAVVAELLRLPEASHHIATMLTGLDIRYPAAGTHPLAGRRVPHVELMTRHGPSSVPRLLRHGRGVLLDASGEDLAARAPVPPSLDVVAADPVRRLGAPAVLIRPDGYAAWAGDGGDAGELHRALGTWFGVPAASGAGIPSADC